jgi:alpha-D-ribose 1-methylphosphonate 5-triphosphate diphosphatase
MSQVKCLFGGPVFDGEHLMERGTVHFMGNEVVEIREGDHPRQADVSADVGGMLIIPGLVDLHSDAVERCIEMRPGVHFDMEFALNALDQRLATCGITTFCHALSFSDNDFGIRSGGMADQMVRMVSRFTGSPHRCVSHRIHARYEVTCPSVLPILEDLIDSAEVDIFSLTDHTPGQGQFRTMEAFLEYQTGMYGVTRDEAVKAAAFKAQQRIKGLEHLQSVCRKVTEAGIPFLSHDDDTGEKVQLVKQLGAGGCEFPVNMATIEVAKRNAMRVFMGAPNLIRDSSSNGHLKASEAVISGHCDGLVSDYYPECLLQAPFVAHRRYGLALEQTLKLVTSRPGAFLSRGGMLGRLSPGGPADLLVVDPTGVWARVCQTWVSGKPVFSQNS